MCTNNTLYRPLEKPIVSLEKRKKGKLMTFSQVSHLTDCLRGVANRVDRPIAELVSELRERALFPKIYAIIDENPDFTKRMVVNRICKLILNKI